MLLFYFDRKLDQMMAAIEYELTFRKCTQITCPNIWPLQLLKTITWGDDLLSLALGGASVWTPILSQICVASLCQLGGIKISEIKTQWQWLINKAGHE